MEGLRNLPAVIRITEKISPHFIALQETWLRTYKNVKVAENFRDYRWIFKNADTQNHPEDQITARNLSFHGTALGVHKSISENMTEVKIEQKNIALAEIRFGKEKLLVASVYLPTMGKDTEFDEALDALAVVLASYPAGEARVLLMGDLNVDVNSSPRRLAAWTSFISDHELDDVSKGQPTHFHKASKSKSELDRAVTRDLQVDVKHIHDDLNISSHIPLQIIFKIPMEDRLEAEKGEEIETKVNIDQLDENIEVFQEMTRHLAEEFRKDRHKYTLDSQNGIISSYIFRAAIETTGQHQFQSQAPKKPKRLKIDKTLYKELRSATRALKKAENRSRKSPEGRRVKLARQAIRLAFEEERKKSDLELHRKIIKAARQKSSKIFRLLKQIRQSEETENKLPGMISGYGKEYKAPRVLEGLRELFRIQTTLDKNVRFDKEAFTLARDVIESRLETNWSEEEYGSIKITREDFEKLINKLKPGKAQDYLGLSNDLVKRVHPLMKDVLHELASDCLANRSYGGLVRNFGKGTLIIKKPGKPVTDVKNWRKIVVNTTLNNIIQIHVQPSIENKVREIQTDYQLGFTSGVPVTNAVIARQEIQAISKHMRKTLFFGVLDLQSCFPRISREQMLLLATEILSPAEWDLMCQIYHQTWGEIRVEGQKSKPMMGNVGSIEGGVLSVQILKLFIAVLLTLLQRAGFTAGVDFKVYKLRGGGICVADDILLFCWSADGMRHMLSICQYWSDKYRATFSPDKSVIVIQRSPKDKEDHGSFELNGEKLKEVSLAEHLGVPIAETGDNSEEILTLRLSKARRSINASLALFDPRSFVNISTKLELWRKQFKSVALYSADTTNMKAGQMRKMENFQTKILKSILGLSKRASTVKTRLLAGSTTMSLDIWKNRLGILNNILDGTTLTRQYCVIAWECEIKSSWTYQTVKKLHEILHDEGAGHISASEFIRREKKTFKEDNKLLLMGYEGRKLVRDLKSDSLLYSLPQLAFKTPMPMLSSDFSSYGQRLVKSFASVYTSDYFRNFDRRCYLCLHKDVPEAEEYLYKDDTKHFLSRKCEIEKSPLAQQTWSEIKETVRRHNSQSIIPTSILSDFYRAKFLLNPTCLSLGQNRISAEDLQSTGIDILIRKFIHFRLKYRYSELRKSGFIIKKRFQFAK